MSIVISNGNCQELDEELKTSIVKHLQSTRFDFELCLFDVKEKETTFAKNAFSKHFTSNEYSRRNARSISKLINDSSVRSIYQ